MPARTWLSKCDEHDCKLADHRDYDERANGRVQPLAEAQPKASRLQCGVGPQPDLFPQESQPPDDRHPIRFS